ncbi:MAG TPA: sugar-binding protein [Phycisphaeraceae bacterium]
MVATALGGEASEAPSAVVFVPDPPPKVDGTLDRFRHLAGWRSLDQAAQVVFGRERWRDAADLSGRAILAWDTEHLYLAAQVKDDAVQQAHYGGELWRGDHVILMLDLPRQPAGARDKTKVIQIGLSPGNFQHGPEGIVAEAFQWSPASGAVPGIRVAAARTAGGYQIEAAIPWNALGVQRAEEGLTFGADIILSDSDDNPPQQQTLMSLLTSSWSLRNPDRLMEMALGSADGKIDPSKLQSTFEPVTGEPIRVKPGGSITFTIPADVAGEVAELVVRYRLEHKKIAGGTHAMALEINGQTLDLERVRNRLARFEMGTLDLASWANTGWFACYAPDFEPADAFSPYAVKGINPYELRFDVRGLWQADQENRVTIRHTRGDRVQHDLVVELGISQRLTPKLTPPPRRPAPTGPLARIEPAGPAKPDYTWRILQGGALEIKLADRQWIVESSYSTLTPGWARLLAEPDGKEWKQLQIDGQQVLAQAEHFRLERRITQHDDHVQVVDRLTNLSDQDLPVMVRHQAAIGQGVRQVYVAGAPVDSPTYYIDAGSAPTSLAVYDRCALGFVSEDDVLRAQGHTFVDNSTIGINNRHLVLVQGRTLELEFSIYPVDSADPFAFVNRIRRNWGTNFTIPGSFCFVAPRAAMENYTVEQLDDYIHNKSAYFVSTTIPRYKPGVWAHGTAIRLASDIETHQQFIEKIKSAAPHSKTLFYYHTFISVGPDDGQRFAQDILRRPDGTQADYRSPVYPLFVPRAGSAFAREMDALIDFRFDVLGVEGIYWDEMEYSAYTYDYSDAYWDGVSADIDPKTHRIRRKISNVPLATQSWRIATAKRILDRGELVANGQPLTRSMTQLHFPRFVETGSMSSLYKAQLYCPVALGDHLTERNAVDCYQNMVKALNYGALYYWYYFLITADQPTLTQHMFPTTPIELGHGYIIAQERILTNRSGLFGWGDGSRFEAFVYDERGRLTDKVQVPVVEQDGKTYAEVRIPEGYAVAIIRR